MSVVSKPRTKVMGILNVTPDSFSDGGHFDAVETAVAHGLQLVKDGADILDIGGESTRPGAKTVEQAEEIDRVIPVISALRSAGVKLPISIDTRRSFVAKAAIAAGGNIWNDVTALEFDDDSLEVAADLNCPVIIMHMRGTPKTMQKSPQYTDVVSEVMNYLRGRIELACAAGVKRSNITIDPGIGFGKRLADNVELMARMDDFHRLKCPILMGTSRKNFISLLDESEAGERLGGSIASALWASNLGADIVRVHDVRQTKQALIVQHAIRGNSIDKP